MIAAILATSSRLTLIAFALIALTGCGNGQVSGTMFLATVGGQAKRAADVPVLLVKWNTTLAEELRQLERAFTSEVQPLREAYEDLRERAERVSPSNGGRYESWKAAHDRAMAELDGITAIQVEYRRRALAALARHDPMTAQTDATGAYHFQGVASGRALILAEWTTQEPVGTSFYPIRHTWMVPVEVKRGENRLDLTGSNTGGAFWSG